MKVLVLYEHLRLERGNTRHMNGFMGQMEPLCSSFNEVLLPRLREKIEKGYTSVDLQKEFKPDVVVVYGNFMKEICTGYFTKMSCAKTVVMVDFQGYLKKNPGIIEKYRKNGFDVIFRRGVSYGSYKPTIPIIWVPFSANENEFYPDNTINRINLIGFAGMVSPSVYVTRRKAIKLLTKAKLLRICHRSICNKGIAKKNKGYPGFLRGHVACLTSTDFYSWPPTPRAKTFEIMGSGTVLLTPYFLGMKEMLGNDGEHYVKYDLSCNDVVKKAREIINDPSRTKAIAKNGYKIFLRRHTDRIRIKEFYGHLARLVEGKPIERRY